MNRLLGVCFFAAILSVFITMFVFSLFLKNIYSDKFRNLSSSKKTNVPSQGTDVIIVGHGRSGTTFLGELFNQNPDVFYVFEPLKPLVDRLHINILFDEETEEYRPQISSVMTSFLSCNMTNNKEVLHEMIGSYVRSLSKVLKENFHLEKFKTADELSLNVSRICGNYQHRVIKVLFERLSNLSITALEDVVKESLLRGRELKILHLVRDPRAVLNSWIRYSWIKNSKDPNFERNVRCVCDSVEKNLKLGEDPPDWLRNRYKLVQYENMVTKPFNISSQIYQFVGIRMAKEVNEWIKSRTKGKEFVNSMLSTMKNATGGINNWKTGLNQEAKLVINRVCSSVIKKLNYGLHL